MANAKTELHIAMVGKYNALEDAYISVVEAVKSAVYHHDAVPVIHWIDAELLEKE